MHKSTLLSSPKYKTFTQDRNRALEQIHLNAQTDLSRLLDERLEYITGFVSHMALEDSMSVHNLQFLSAQLDSYVFKQFYSLLPLIEGRMKRMRMASFILTFFSETEAIARGKGLSDRRIPQLMGRYAFQMQLQNQMKRHTLLDQDLDKRLWVILSQLRLRIVDAFNRALSLEAPPNEVVQAVQKAYPPKKVYRRPPRTLKPLREADSHAPKKEFTFYFDLMDDSEWNAAVDAYKDTELPPGRFDQAPAYDADVGHMRYDWELEQEVTDDFVQQVRDGQVSAAKDLGVEEFVWIAIMDNDTCRECCRPRNGKTTSEIEAMLESGTLDDVHCDATVPPAHPNCRCDLAPIGSTDEVEGADWKSFQDWLDT